jgi:hypothetical protein
MGVLWRGVDLSSSVSPPATARHGNIDAVHDPIGRAEELRARSPSKGIEQTVD